MDQENTALAISKKFKHAKDFEIRGNANNKTLEAYKKVLENHVRTPDTKIIRGTYHGEPVTHYYNPKNRMNVMRDSKGEFKSSWRLDEQQIKHMERNGKLGGGRKK